MSLLLGVRHFSHEIDPMIACPCDECGHRDPQPHFIYRLDLARELARTGFQINSMCRCANHNRDAGGIDDSAHVKGLAADIAAGLKVTRGRIVRGLYAAGFDQITVYPTHVHVELDPAHSGGLGLGN